MTNSKNLTTPRAGVHQVILDLLVDSFGNVVSNRALAAAADQSNYTRRLRELRAEGWAIKYSAKQNGYQLLSLELRGTSADEYVNLRLRSEVFERDHYQCQMCGYNRGELFLDGEAVKLEADHIIPLADKGKTVVDNLQTLCSKCNAGKKAVAAYSVHDDTASIVIRMKKAHLEKLEQAAATEGISVKDIIRTRLES